MKNSNYTLLILYRRGVYLSQFHVSEPIDALKMWVNSVDAIDIGKQSSFYDPGEWTKRLREQIKNNDADQVAVPLRGVTNCWIAFFRERDAKVFIYIMKTAEN